MYSLVGYDPINEIRYKSSYEHESPDDKLYDLKERYGLSKIWPQ